MFGLNKTVRRAGKTTFNQARKVGIGKFMAVGGAASGMIWAASESKVCFAEEQVNDAKEDVFETFETKKPGLAKSKKKKSNYPGKYEDNAKESNEITQAQTFTGGRYTFNYSHFPQEQGAAAGSRKQLVGAVTVSLSPQIPEGSSIDFSAQSIFHGGALILASQLSVQGENTPYRVHGRVISKDLVVKDLTGRVSFNIIPEAPMHNQLTTELDYKGADFNVKAAVLRQAGNFSTQASYFQSLTQTLSAGVELEAAPVQMMAALGGAVRYSTLKTKMDGEAYTAHFDLGKTLHLKYAKQLGPGFTGTSSISYTYPKDTEVKTGFMVQTQTGMLCGNLDSTGKVSSILEIALMGPFRVSSSADFNHSTSESNFGIGFTYA